MENIIKSIKRASYIGAGKIKVSGFIMDNSENGLCIEFLDGRIFYVRNFGLPHQFIKEVTYEDKNLVLAEDTFKQIYISKKKYNHDCESWKEINLYLHEDLKKIKDYTWGHSTVACLLIKDNGIFRCPIFKS